MRTASEESGNVDLEMSKVTSNELGGYTPVKSHIRVLEPILSPNRPTKAPATKPSREHNACLSEV